jgi:hypothetical protein
VDPRERVLDEEETLRMAFEGMISRVWTALPGIVQAVTNNGNTLEVQPAINGRARQTDGTYKSIQMPKLVDVPICWQGGGGATWTFPIAAGDECLVVFASRCIDQWWQSGYTAPAGQVGADGKPVNKLNDPPEFRLHNLSDGFAIVGVRSLKRRFTQFDSATARLRTDDDSCYLEFDPVNKILNGVFPGGINLNGVTIDSSGNVGSPATVTATTDVVGGGKHLKTHVHSGVTTGGSNTGAPV